MATHQESLSTSSHLHSVDDNMLFILSTLPYWRAVLTTLYSSNTFGFAVLRALKAYMWPCYLTSDEANYDGRKL